MNRSKPAALLAAAALCLALAGCAGTAAPNASSAAPASSAPASAPASGPAQASSAPPSSASEPSASSAPASSRAEDEWVRHDVTLPVDGDVSNVQVLVLETPADWTFDSYTTFTGPDGRKTAEVAALYTVADEMSFPEEVTAQYENDGGMYPEGYGLQRVQLVRVYSRMIETYYYKTWPDDADRPWYPRYCFVNLGGCVVQVNFFTFDEEADDDVFNQVIGSMELHAVGETAGDP